MKILFGNYGDNFMALLQWAVEAGLCDAVVVSIDTGWAAQGWHERVQQAQMWAREQGFSVERIAAAPSFPALVKDRGQFPSQKFQWCAGFLKGLPLLYFLDQQDPLCEAQIYLGSRLADSKLRTDLPSEIPDSEHYGGRRVIYPLSKLSHIERDALVKSTGFELLNGRSLECQPCIHCAKNDIEKMAPQDQCRLSTLEHEVNASFLLPDNGSASIEEFDLGCGAPYACGE